MTATSVFTEMLTLRELNRHCRKPAVGTWCLIRHPRPSPIRFLVDGITHWLWFDPPSNPKWTSSGHLGFVLHSLRE
jgi:hypothetical protein